MNGRDRTLAAIHGQPHDRVPVSQHNFWFAARYAGLTMREFRSDPDRAAQALADAADDLGYDCIMTDFDTCTLAEAMGTGVEFPEDDLARAVRPAVRSLREVPGLPLPDPNRDGRLPVWLETTRRLRAKVGQDRAIMGRADQGPFGLLFLLLDSQQFLMDLLAEEGTVIAAALAHCMRAGVAFARAQLDCGADLTSIGDSAAGQSVVSPQVYRRFAQPFEKQYRAELGGLLSLHICGKTDQIVRDMAATGAEVLELDHCNDLGTAFAAIGPRACVFGNIDPSSVLMQGTPELVLEKSRQAIEAARRAEARFVLCPGCALGASTPAENIAAMTEAARRFGNWDES